MCPEKNFRIEVVVVVVPNLKVKMRGDRHPISCVCHSTCCTYHANPLASLYEISVIDTACGKMSVQREKWISVFWPSVLDDGMNSKIRRLWVRDQFHDPASK